MTNKLIALMNPEEFATAGSIKIRNGQLITISHNSGHYAPSRLDLLDVCNAIKAHYDNYDKAFVFFADFEAEFGPKEHTYMIPMNLFIGSNGVPPGLGDYHGELLYSGEWRYTNPERALAGGGATNL